MTQFVKTIDGQMWIMGRGGAKLLTKPTVIIEHVAEPEPEPQPAPKKKKKTYKLHYTKPWRGTVGKFLSTFGPDIYPYIKPNEQSSHTADYFDGIGNMYYAYQPGTGYPNRMVLTHRTKTHLFVATHHQMGALLKPEHASHFSSFKVLYAHLREKLIQQTLNPDAYGIPLEELGPPEFGPPEPTLQLMADLKELAELEAAQLEEKPAEKKQHRGCTTPDCKWCNGTQVKPKVQKKVPKIALVKDKGKACQLCRASYHPWQECAGWFGIAARKWLPELPHDDWKNDFCRNCGSIDHDADNCDWVPPPQCTHCGNWGHEDDNCTAGTGRGSNGHMQKAPWEKRGVVINQAREWRHGGPRDREAAEQDVWLIESQEWNPVEANANLVILEFIASDTLHGSGLSAVVREDPDMRMIVDEARQRFKAHVGYIDPRLRNYCDMVVGGELRHHKAVGGRALPTDSRPAAWKAWKEIRRRLGTDALLDAVILFEDFTRASYGGPKWGLAAKLLWMRETGRISPFIFCDKVFDMQHNCGSLLNKVNWGGDFRLELIQTWLGPARAKKPQDWTVINHFGSKDTVRLFNEYWERANRLSRFTGITPEPVPRARWYIDKNGQYMSVKHMKKKPAHYASPGTKFHYEHWKHSYNDGHCAYCGDGEGGIEGLYHCEVGGCTGNAAYFCYSHGMHCKACGVWMCPQHEKVWCYNCAHKANFELKANPKFLGVHTH